MVGNIWLAIVVYSIGLGLVIHFKPSVMFNENGSWKEFGYQRSSRHTIFPFWLFTITWAFVSYVLVVVLMSGFVNVSSVPPAVGVSMGVGMGSLYVNETDEDEMDETNTNTNNNETTDENGNDDMAPNTVPQLSPTQTQTQTPGKRGPGRPRKIHPKQGYYVIDPNTTDSGLRRYIYYGPEPPTD